MEDEIFQDVIDSTTIESSIEDKISTNQEYNILQSLHDLLSHELESTYTAEDILNYKCKIRSVLLHLITKLEKDSEIRQTLETKNNELEQHVRNIHKNNKIYYITS